MPESRRKFDPQFREGAARIVRETGKPVAQVAHDLGIGAETLPNRVEKDKVERGEAEGLSRDERAELAQLRREGAELRMERVLKRGMVFWGQGGDGEPGGLHRLPEGRPPRPVRGQLPGSGRE